MTALWERLFLLGLNFFFVQRMWQNKNFKFNKLYTSILTYNSSIVKKKTIYSRLTFKTNLGLLNLWV